MKRSRRAVLVGLAALLVAVASYAAFLRLAAPKAAARAGSYRVWISLLKGFDGDVYYVGNDSTNAYFRMGRVFWSYYKVPACAAQTPQLFAVGAGDPYVVRLHVHSDNTIHSGKSCSGQQGYELGPLDRAGSQ